MAFRLTDQVQVQRDDEGVVRRLRHPRQPYAPEDSDSFALARSAAPMSVRELADDYLREVLPLFEADARMADDLDAAVGAEAGPDEGPKLRHLEDKELPSQAAVSYVQTHLGLPVWEAGVVVKLAGSPPQVIGSQSSMHPEIQVDVPPADAPYYEAGIDPESLAELLGFEGAERPTINGTRLLIYRLDAGDRGNAAGEPQPTDETMMHVAGPTLDLPPLPSELVDGRHFVAVEVLFSLESGRWGPTNWGAFIEPRTGAVLRVDSFIGCVDGRVYRQDPPSRTGSNSLRPTSSAASLDALRDTVALDGLRAPAAGANQALAGEFVRLENVLPPNVAVPTRPAGQRFDFSVPSDDFAAVNAYFHCDRLFRLLAGLGFDVRSYFDGTSFPVRVDHRFSYSVNGVLTGNVVNASAPGNTTHNGSDGFRFALLERNTNVGMALHWRVILHEFGHSILWDHLDSPNFPFAHSPGDSLAAILNDPDSRAPDRFVTFPWTPIDRRHDRRPQDGWAWGGRFDDPFSVGHPSSLDRAGYQREQILSSTLFRYYRAIGGDHTDPAVRLAASRYAAFLIFSAVGAMSSVVQPRNAEDLAEDLMDADLAVTELEGLAGGTTHKVVRWAFEQQGAYQPPGVPRPVTRPGAPPAVDVYVDDGRGGGYDPQGSFQFSSADVWNRRAADAGTTHQEAVAGRQNFLFVRVKNRGTRSAANVVVEAFSTRAQGERLFPTEWTALDTPSARAAAPVASGGETVVGPFQWNPGAEGPIAVLVSASADGDPSNADSVPGPVIAARLAHCDNNVAGRMMQVVAPPEEEDEDGETVRAEIQPRLAIPDADPNGVMSEMLISAPGTIRRVVVSATVPHTFIGDLRVTLESPLGTEAVLFEGGGLSQPEDDLTLTRSSDDTPALAAFRGEPAQGPWRLRVVDRIGIDVGSLERWSLALTLDDGG